MYEQHHLVPTVGEIARRFGTSIHRVEYAIRAHDIQPAGRAGNARVFSEDSVSRIGMILNAAQVHEGGDGGDHRG